MCLLCERKHVPGLIPGWDLVTLPGSVPERALCEQKPDQCRNECVVVMTHFVVQLFYRVFWRQINVHTMKKCVNWNEAAIRELLTICAEAEIILQFSEMVSAHYTRHMKGHVSLRDLYGLCVNARTYSRKSLAVWMQQIWWSGNKCRNTLPVYFPESLCERGFRETTSVQENVVLANIKALDLCVCGCMYTHAITLTHTHIYAYKLLWELPNAISRQFVRILRGG